MATEKPPRDYVRSGSQVVMQPGLQGWRGSAGSPAGAWMLSVSVAVGDLGPFKVLLELQKPVFPGEVSKATGCSELHRLHLEAHLSDLAHWAFTGLLADIAKCPRCGHVVQNVPCTSTSAREKRSPAKHREQKHVCGPGQFL